MPSIDDSKCVLITGGTSGIGRALALDIAKLPSHPKVIATGRRKDRLDELSAAGLQAEYLDLSADTTALKKSVDDLIARYPDLDTVILNAGIQHQVKAKDGIDMKKITEEIHVNYISVVAFISYILPHFLKLSEAGRPTFIVTVTSGLAVVPLAAVANYSASKAALSSFTLSLRAQLAETNVNVLEIVPPLVESELHDPYGTTEALSKFWMPLDEFTRLTVNGLREGRATIADGTSKALVEKYNQGKFEAVMQGRKMTEKW
ncbi:hypothetical protein D9613_001971 [Agrocybe pediades]|uniref:NAD(P)-binding protein n=1 Tax=Agrocybe pediades TaxID=84607 RepID=A0A8H4R4Z3_9AGAR|nr:hypothetical protein D9613_001971 [Agrocybe pediades]